MASFNNSTEFACAPEKTFNLVRFLLLNAASAQAAFGLGCNVLLAILFSRRKHREPNLAILATFDAALCLAYILLFGLEAWVFYFKIRFLFDILMSIHLYGLVCGRAIQRSIAALLVFASLQRWALIYGKKLGCWSALHTVWGRTCLSIIMVTVACGTAVPDLWAHFILHLENCTSFFETKTVYKTEFFKSPFYSGYSQVFFFYPMVPFVLLLACNLSIVLKFKSSRLQRQNTVAVVMSAKRRRQNMSRMHGVMLSMTSGSFKRELKEAIKFENDAILTMVVIVCSYLLCNSFHLPLNAIERYYPQHTIDSWIYELARDMVNYLFMLSSTLRLAIHQRFKKGN